MLLARVTVSHASLKISIKRDRLLAILTDKIVERSQNDDQDNIISLKVTVPAASGRRIRQARLRRSKCQNA